MLALSLICATLGAKGPGATEYAHRVWRIEDGLPQNRIRAISQTPDGYLWIGTSEGLARFDGVRFRIFNRANTPALQDDGILHLLLTRDGALWIGTEGGGVVRYRNGEFRNYSTAEGLTNGFVRAIYQDRGGSLWIGTDRGIFRMEGDRFRRLDGTPEIPSASFNSFAEDDAGRIWTTSTVGLLAIAGGKLTKPGHACADPQLRALQASSHGFFRAVRPAGGASEVRDGCAVPDRSLPTYQLKSITEDRDGNLWIATAGHGVIRSVNGDQTTFTAPSVLPDNTVNTVFEDRQGNLWIGCEDGLVRLSRSSVTNIGSAQGLDDDNIATVYPDRAGTLWIATLTGQIYRVRGASMERFHLPAPAADLLIRTVWEDREGTMWFGSYRGGLVRLKGNTATIYDKERGGLRSLSVRQILEDRSGAIWLALDSGFSRLDGEKFTNYYLPDGLSYPSTRCMISDNRGDILIGTDRGLNRVHDGRIVRDTEFAALAEEKIWAIYQDPSGTLWIGTRGSGLIRFRSGTISRFTTNNGLPSNSIFQIIDDGKGRLWASTSAGVVALDRQELETAASQNGPLIQAVQYGTADGMATSQMNGGLQPAGAMSSSGDLWFPSVKGAVGIDPGKTQPQAAMPILIERMSADDRPVPLSGAVTIPPGHGKLDIDFTLCDLSSPESVTFRYQLEGFDDASTVPGRGRSAHYTNLPPGRYRFRVAAGASVARTRDVPEASLAFTLRPAFYQTSWFYGLVALFAASGIWGGFTLYARQTRARYALLLAERTRLAREMHDTVIQGCVGVSTLLEALDEYRHVDGARADRLLDQARTAVQKTLEEAREAVWDLRRPQTDESCIPMLFDLARKLGHENRIEVETQIVGTASLDPETDRAIMLVGREALRNAVAHAHPRRIEVKVVFGARRVDLEVNDDGDGFEAGANGSGESKHFGLIGMRERVEESGGTFSVQTNPGRGTRVAARLPLDGRTLD